MKLKNEKKKPNVQWWYTLHFFIKGIDLLSIFLKTGPVVTFCISGGETNINNVGDKRAQLPFDIKMSKEIEKVLRLN